MANPSRLPVDEQTRARARELMAEDWPRNRIARELEISGPTVTSIAREIGHEFDRSKTELAVRAHQIDMALMRELLAKLSLDEAWQALEDMHAPAKMVQFESGNPVSHFNEDGVLLRTEHAPGSFREHIIDEPSFSDKRNLATVYGIMITKAGELSRASESSGTTEALSFVDGMKTTLDVIRDRLAAEPETDPTVEPTNVSREAMLKEFDTGQDDPTPDDEIDGQ